jgi:uncharacterized protein YjbI with pentapeptide repeats
MIVFKPNQCALITRPIEFKKRFGLCITNHLFVSFSDGTACSLMSEQSLWKFVSEKLNPAMLDEGVTKSTAEYHVCGSAYTTADSPNACAVKISLGASQKTLLAFGERYWNNGKTSQPEPFSSMPIDWLGAYGGADYPLNTLGKGRATQSGVQWLPNFEYAHDRLLRPDQRITPAGFGLRDVTHPERVALQGTYDGSYLKEHSPGFVPDLDWSYFNLAPHDQWIPSGLVGDEAFRIENMHPSKPVLSGSLPKLRTKAFVSYEGKPEMREVPMRLTTVLFFPDSEQLVLSFQGLAECGLDDGSDIAELLLGVETLNEPKSQAQYEAIVTKRKDKDLGAVHALNDDDLLPDGLSLRDPIAENSKAAFAMDGLQMDAQVRKAGAEVLIARKKAISLGKDPDKLGLKMPAREKAPSVQELPKILKEQQEAFKKSQWDAIDDMVTHLEKLVEYKKQFKAAPVAEIGAGPPVLKTATTLSQMKAAMPNVTGAELAELAPKLVALDVAQMRDYQMSAHHQHPAKRMEHGEAQALRKEMGIAISKGIKYFAGVNFTGADFSNLDLRDSDFSGALLESVDFTGSNISKSKFLGSVLAHTVMDGTIAIGTDFSLANLGASTLNNVVFDESIFPLAVLESAILNQVSMRGCDLVGAKLHDAKWNGCDLTEAKLSGQLFNKADLQHTVFCDAQLQSCNFFECDLSNVEMEGANLSNATFYKTKLVSAKLNNIVAVGAIFVEETDLTNAQLRKANLSGANLGNICFKSTMLVEANLNGANCTKTDFSQADLRLSTGIGGLFRYANLSFVKAAGANFKDAVLQNADLRGGDFRRSNLFAADLGRVRLSADTRFDESLMNRARTYPRLSVAQQNLPQSEGA